MRTTWSRIGVVAVVGRAVAQLESVDKCGQDCVNSVIAKGPSMGCDVGAVSCLCANPNFIFGVRDCALQSCGEAVAKQATDYASSLCATATLARVTSSSAPAVSQAPQAPVTPAPPTTTETVQIQTSRPATGGAKSAETARQSTEAASLSPESTEAAAKTSSSNSPVASSNSDTAGASKPNGSSGLTVGAKVGIGIGAAVVAITVGAIVFLLLSRSRAKKARDSNRDLHISGPMPGSGRDFGDYKEAHRSELEMRSRRYEDMVPRTRPSAATMI